MANCLHTIPQADQALLSILGLAQQTHKAFKEWREKHPNDVFFRSHWGEIDDLDTAMIGIKCDIASLIGTELVDHLE